MMSTDLREATDGELLAELQQRGFVLPGLRIKTAVDSERNTAPEEKWLSVWTHLNEYKPGDPSASAQAHLLIAVQKLYLLLEPLSVRERRLNSG